MSNWDRFAMMGVIDTARQKIGEHSTSELQKVQLQALVDRFGNRAKTVLASSADVHAIKEELCQICKLGPSCFIERGSCCKP